MEGNPWMKEVLAVQGFCKTLLWNMAHASGPSPDRRARSLDQSPRLPECVASPFATRGSFPASWPPVSAQTPSLQSSPVFSWSLWP